MYKTSSASITCPVCGSKETVTGDIKKMDIAHIVWNYMIKMHFEETGYVYDPRPSFYSISEAKAYRKRITAGAPNVP
jgi:hypothetical protein